MLLRLSIVGILLAAVLIAPFALRPDSEQGGLNLGKSVERLVIITPHNESIVIPKVLCPLKEKC